MRRVAVVLVGVTLLPGCGERQPFVSPMRVVERGPMVFRHVAPLPSTAPGPGPSNLVFFDARHGFVATTGGAGWMPKVGFQAPRDRGRIERTDDGGRTWRTVRSARNVVFEQLVFADRRVGLAAGGVFDIHTYKEKGYTSPPRSPIILVTRDGGKHWKRIGAQGFGSAWKVQLASPTTWYAFGPWLRRTTDAGRTWTHPPVPRGTSIVRFLSARVGFAAAAEDCPPLRQRLWKTIDGAGSWQPVTQRCDASLQSLDFVDPGHAFATTGAVNEDGALTPLLVRATRDGGRTWHTLHRPRDWPVPTMLRFTDLRRGWAVSSEWNQGMRYDELHVTADGGRTWQKRRFPTLPIAFVGGTAWAADPLRGELWRTTSWGRRWSLSMRPAELNPDALLVATPELLAVEAAETLVSRDGGRSWRTSNQLTPLELALAQHAPAYIQPTNEWGFGVAYVAVENGWRPVSARGGGWARFSADVAFADARHGLLVAGQFEGKVGSGRTPVFSTANGGRTWSIVKLPPGVADGSEVSLGPGTIMFPDPFLSVDSGRHWLTFRPLPEFARCGVSRRERSIWILCSADAADHGPDVLLHTSDAGRTWSRRSAREGLDPHIVALSETEAWAADANPWLTRRTLWHTTDGGRSWRQVWLHLPALSPAYRLQQTR